MRVFENKFIIIDFFEEKSYFKVIRKGFDNEFSDEEYKYLIVQWKDQIVMHKPTFQLVDYLNFFKPIPVNMQKWINENLLAPSYEAGLKKVAFIISRDFYAQVSLEQLMLEKEGKKFRIKYFGNEADAEKWLFEDNN